jgi:putative oxidoreductase
MFGRLLHTTDDLKLTLLRLFLGVIFFAHGAQKALGWFGGHGWSATVNQFTTYMNIPEPLAYLAIAAEFLGGLGLILGLLGRVAAFGILCNMLVAIFMVHLPNGLFMNWAGNQKGEGIEYHLLAVAIALVVIMGGSGAWSIDRALSRAEYHRHHGEVRPLPA